MSKTSILPEFLQEDMEQTESKSTKTRRIKMEKGHAWLVRFVPAELGPKKQYFAKFSFHWINKIPVLCPKNTHVDFGGKGEDYNCPLCNVCEDLNADGDEAISKIGYRASAVDQWLMYAVVYEKDDGRNIDPVPKSEMYRAWEFWMTKTTWEDFRSELARGYRRNPELSVLDWDNGNDFWLESKKRGFGFTREDPSPIAEKDIDAVIDKIMDDIKLPQNKIPTTAMLQDKADKLEDYAFGNSEDDDRGSRRGNRSRADEDDDRGLRRGNRSRADEEEEARPTRSSRRRAPADEEEEARPTRSSRRRAPADEEEDDVPMNYDKEDGGENVKKDDRPPSARRGNRPARQSNEERPAKRSEERPAKRSEDAESERPARRGGRHVESSVDEDDNAPEERHDPAPPAEMEDDPTPDADSPPDVEATGETDARPSRVSDRVRRGLKRNTD